MVRASASSARASRRGSASSARYCISPCRPAASHDPYNSCREHGGAGVRGGLAAADEAGRGAQDRGPPPVGGVGGGFGAAARRLGAVAEGAAAQAAAEAPPEREGGRVPAQPRPHGGAPEPHHL